MPTYPVIHKETGEKKELSMTMVEYSNWRDDNPDWDKDWSEGCAGLGEVGEWKDKLITKNPCLLYTSPSPRDAIPSRMPSSA